MEENKKEEEKEISDKTFKTHILLITYAIFLFMAIYNFQYLWKFVGILMGIITPLLIGLGIAFVINIPMSFIEKNILGFMDKLKRRKGKELHSLKRGLAIVLTYIFLLGILSGIITFVIPQLSDSVNTLIEKLPGYIISFNTLTDELLAFFKLPNILWENITVQWEIFTKQIGGIVLDSVPRIFNATKSVTLGVFNTMMGFILSIYMLADKERLLHLKDKLIYAYIPKERADFIQDVSITANRVFHGFISGQLTEAFILGTLCSLGLAILQVPYALLIGVLVGVTSVIPVFGAFLGAVPSAFILLVMNPWYCLVFVIFIVVLQQIESNVIYPKVVGNSIGLSGLWVLIGMMIGGSIFGFLGIILGIPAFAVLYSVLKKVTHERIAMGRLNK